MRGGKFAVCVGVGVCVWVRVSERVSGRKVRVSVCVTESE